MLKDPTRRAVVCASTSTDRAMFDAFFGPFGPLLEYPNVYN